MARHNDKNENGRPQQGENLVRERRSLQGTFGRIFGALLLVLGCTWWSYDYIIPRTRRYLSTPSPPERGIVAYTLDKSFLIQIPHEHNQQKVFTQGLEVRYKEGLSEESISRKPSLSGCLGLKSRSAMKKCVLQIVNDYYVIYESSGLYSRSFLRKIEDWRTGKTAKVANLNSRLFAEDFAITDDGILHLATWKEKELLRVDVRHGEFAYIDTLKVDKLNEGWGVCTDGVRRLWMTDGGDTLFEFRLPLSPTKNYKTVHVAPTRTVKMQCMGKALSYVNAMDYRRSTRTIWANVWGSTRVFEIHPESGKCVSFANLNNIQNHSLAAGRADDVWNGITFIEDEWVLVTGKNFPYMYVGRIVPI